MALRLKRIPGFELEKAAIKQALKELTPEARRDLQRLDSVFRRARPARKGEKWTPQYAMRMLTLDLLENWERLTCYQKEHEPLADGLARKIPRTYKVPSTNPPAGGPQRMLLVGVGNCERSA